MNIYYKGELVDTIDSEAMKESVRDFFNIPIDRNSYNIEKMSELKGYFNLIDVLSFVGSRIEYDAND